MKIKTIKNVQNDLFECGWGNGYVVLPEGHPLWGKDLMDECMSFNVHGGVTYAGPVSREEGGWMLGFDTKHGCDNLEIWPDKASVVAEAERLRDEIEKYYPSDRVYLDGKVMEIDGVKYRLTLV